MLVIPTDCTTPWKQFDALNASMMLPDVFATNENILEPLVWVYEDVPHLLERLLLLTIDSCKIGTKVAVWTSSFMKEC